MFYTLIKDHVVVRFKPEYLYANTLFTILLEHNQSNQIHWFLVDIIVGLPHASPSSINPNRFLDVAIVRHGPASIHNSNRVIASPAYLRVI